MPQNQKHELASICKKINKEDGMIDWKLESFFIERLVRAYNPWPSAWSILKDEEQVLKIHSAKNIIADHNQNDIGKIFFVSGITLVRTCTFVI